MNEPTMRGSNVSFFTARCEASGLRSTRTLMGGLSMHVVGSLAFAVFTVVSLILFAVVLSGMFYRKQ